MRRLALVLVLFAACKKSDDKKEVTPPPAPGSGSAAAAPGPTPAPPAAAKPLTGIACDKLISPDVADKYFKGATAKHDEPMVGEKGDFAMTTCRFVLDPEKNRKIIINVNCGPDFANLDEYYNLLKAQISAKFERVEGVGRGGFRIGTSTTGAQHRTLPCMVLVDTTFLDDNDPERTKDWMPLVKDLEAAIPQ